MATIKGGRLIYVEAKRDRQDINPSGMNMNVQIENVEAGKDEITVSYEYTVTYNDAIGTMKLRGIVFLQETPKEAKEIAKEWKEKKKFTPEFTEVLLNYISYVAGVAGTFFSQPLGLGAPLMLAPIKMRQEGGKLPGAGKGTA